ASLISIFMKNIIAGTITIPPPTPKSPLVTPLIKPMTPAMKNCMLRYGEAAQARPAQNGYGGIGSGAVSWAHVHNRGRERRAGESVHAGAMLGHTHQGAAIFTSLGPFQGDPQ